MAMLTKKTLSLLGAAAAVGLALSPMAQAASYSDTGAAVIIYPKIIVDDSRDTVLTITNQASQPTAAHCFYVNGNPRCDNTGAVCDSRLDCEEDLVFGNCQPGWIEINFDIILTRDQPLAWSARRGLSSGGKPGESLADGKVPCPGGFADPCIPPETNAGTRVPPVGETPFVGELKCFQTDRITRLPIECQGAACRNDLEGTATITKVEFGQIDTQEYNAVGLRTSAAGVNGDSLLIIGGGAAEFQPCPEVLVFNHLFDFAVDPISGFWEAHSELSLVPCTQNLLTQEVPRVTAQFLVYNEFEQRLSTSRTVQCLLTTPISLIDTTQPARSIWNAALQGTVAGQTKITGVQGGLIGVASLNFCAPDLAGGCASMSPELIDAGAAYNLNQRGDRELPDFILIP
jgi:hypothetical protein